MVDALDAEIFGAPPLGAIPEDKEDADVIGLSTPGKSPVSAQGMKAKAGAKAGSELTNRLRIVFDRLDKDGNGVLDRKEIIGALRKDKELREMLRLSSNPKEAVEYEEVFRAIDKDANRTLSWEEMCEYFTKLNSEVSKPSSPNRKTSKPPVKKELLSPGPPVKEGKDEKGVRASEASQHKRETIAGRVRDDTSALVTELHEQFNLAQATSLQSFSQALGYEGLQIAGNEQMEALIAEAFKPLEQVTLSRMNVLAEFVELHAFEEPSKGGLEEKLERARLDARHAHSEKDQVQKQLNELCGSIKDLGALLGIAPSEGAEKRSETGTTASASSNPAVNPAVLLRSVVGRVAEIVSGSKGTKTGDESRIKSMDSEIAYLTNLLEVASAELESNTGNLEASQGQISKLQNQVALAETRATEATEAANQSKALLRVRSQRFHELLQVKATAQSKVEAMEVELEAVKAAAKATMQTERARNEQLEKTLRATKEKLDEASKSNRVLSLENSIAVEHLRRSNIGALELPSDLESVLDKFSKAKPSPPPATAKSPPTSKASPKTATPPMGKESPHNHTSPGAVSKSKSPRTNRKKEDDSPKITWVYRAPHGASSSSTSTSTAPSSSAAASADQEPSPSTTDSTSQGRALGELPKFWKAMEHWKHKCNVTLSAAGVKVPSLSPDKHDQPKGPMTMHSLRTPTFLKKDLVETVGAGTVDTLMVSLKKLLVVQGIKLPVERMAPFKYTLGSKNYNLKVTNGAIRVRKGGGFADVVDIISGLCPRSHGHNALDAMGISPTQDKSILMGLKSSHSHDLDSVLADTAAGLTVAELEAELAQEATGAHRIDEVVRPQASMSDLVENAKRELIEDL